MALTYIPEYAISDLAKWFLDTSLLYLCIEFLELVYDSFMCGRYLTLAIVLHITYIWFIHDLKIFYSLLSTAAREKYKRRSNLTCNHWQFPPSPDRMRLPLQLLPLTTKASLLLCLGRKQETQGHDWSTLMEGDRSFLRRKNPKINISHNNILHVFFFYIKFFKRKILKWKKKLY